jgi:hypothetical protein
MGTASGRRPKNIARDVEIQLEGAILLAVRANEIQTTLVAHHNFKVTMDVDVSSMYRGPNNTVFTFQPKFPQLL